MLTWIHFMQVKSWKRWLNGSDHTSGVEEQRPVIDLKHHTCSGLRRPLRGPVRCPHSTHFLSLNYVSGFKFLFPIKASVHTGWQQVRILTSLLGAGWCWLPSSASTGGRMPSACIPPASAQQGSVPVVQSLHFPGSKTRLWNKTSEVSVALLVCQKHRTTALEAQRYTHCGRLASTVTWKGARGRSAGPDADRAPSPRARCWRRADNTKEPGFSFMGHNKISVLKENVNETRGNFSPARWYKGSFSSSHGPL